ncbi:solute carrier family 35 member G1-like [Stegodyphus dumicola]|uniref:solute carrier family 35 member G1-like n=1 Tax=Stegodyphus dumicola TaxID=202533 RepID=UPI0015B06363|nr:solute carrier family 35 member G1-like [Stegodyphus dumicola]XP_035231173.1 solute carrier family 35 member G1-like [Stegodyphus dumicola]
MFRKAKYSVTNIQQAPTLSTESIISKSSSTYYPKEKEEVVPPSINYKSFLALFYVLISSIFLMLASVIMKKITYVNSAQMSIVRHAGLLVFSLPVAIYCKKNILGPKEYRLSLIILSFLTSTSLFLYLMAFKYLPLTEVAIIISTTPAVVGISARMYLKEPCGRIQIFATILTLCGVLLSIDMFELIKKREVTKFNVNFLTGLLCVVSSVIFMSVSYVWTRKLKDIHFSVILIFSGFIGVLENATIAATISSCSWPRCGYDPLLITLFGIICFLGHLALLLAVQIEHISIVSVTKAAMDIIVAMVYQMVFFKSYPNLYNIGEALLVIICIGIIGIKKWLEEIPEDTTMKKRLKWLLL